jgi:hypothetical protein
VLCCVHEVHAARREPHTRPSDIHMGSSAERAAATAACLRHWQP